MKLESVDKVDVVTADGRGRVTIGSEFADTKVKVYVKRVDE